MTREQYRAHMRRYSRETMVMSFVVTRHPDFQALSGAGMDIVPFLLEDLQVKWFCQKCNGHGTRLLTPEEAESSWHRESRELWNKHHPDAPSNTVEVWDVCSECEGYGSVNTWAVVTLLAQAVGDKRPKIEEWMRGRHDPIVKVWIKWGQQNGYLPGPEIPEVKRQTLREKLTRLLFPSS